MKVKRFFILGLTMCLINALSAKDPFGTLTLDGGKVEPVSLTMIGATNEHMNFCFANNFPDGTIYMNHSEGIHTVSEYGVWRRSLDNGKTWEKTPFSFGGFNTFVNKDGKKCQIGCWNDKISDTHRIRLQVMNDEQTGFTDYYSTIKLPFKSSFRLHRDVIRTRDGRLLLNGYLRKEGAAKLTAFVIESKDEGMSWNYLATIMEDTQKKYPEGPNETTMVELANGEILAFVRTGAPAPLFQFRSKDGGKSWGEATIVDNAGVNPSAKLLQNGTLALISGRPNLYLYLDFTGTGKNFQKYLIWKGSTSSYASILEVEPNKLMVIYDESDFGSWRNGSRFSRIMAATYNVIKDDALKAIKIAHPEAKNYKIFYSPECKEAPTYRNMFVPFAYEVKEKQQNGAWFEIKEIAERPYPVLHLVSKGEKPPFKFGHYNKDFDEEFSEIEIGWELRIGDMSLDTPQFRVLAQLEKSGSLTYVGCGKDAIFVFENNVQKRIPYEMGEGFKAFVLKANGNDNSFAVYEKGKPNPIYVGKMTKVGNVGNKVQIGDGSNQIHGEVDLAYLGINYK